MFLGLGLLRLTLDALAGRPGNWRVSRQSTPNHILFHGRHNRAGIPAIEVGCLQAVNGPIYSVRSFDDTGAVLALGQGENATEAIRNFLRAQNNTN